MPVVAHLAILTLSACLSWHPYYETTALGLEPVGEENRAWLEAEVRHALRKKKVDELVVLDASGSVTARLPGRPGASDLAGLDLRVLRALEAGLSASDRGAEWDLWVPLEGKGREAVTLRWTDARHVEVQVGRTGGVDRARDDVDVEAEHARLGLGKWLEDGAPWRPEDRARLIRGLALLSPEEAVALRGVDLVRAVRPPPGDRTDSAGQAVLEGSRESLRFYQRTFQWDDRIFVGAVDTPYHLSSFHVVHEAGHALANEPLRRASALDEERVKARNVKVKELNGKVDDYNRLVREWNAHPRRQAELRPRVDALSAEVDDLRRLTDAMEADLEDLRRLKAAWVMDNPVVNAFREVRGGDRGPTEYGRVNPGESFAEAFALHKTDPAALARIWPEVAAWFARGGHLEAMKAALDLLPAG